MMKMINPKCVHCFEYSGYDELNMKTGFGSYSGDGYIESVEYDENQKLIVIKCFKE